jgi:hypothetical protein
MEIFEWLAHVVLFIVVLKVVQIVFWNVRKKFYIHPWVIEVIIALLIVPTHMLLNNNHWWMTVLIAVFIGVIRGDQEQEEGKQRQLM